GAIDEETIVAALADEEAEVRKTAVWISEPWLQKGDPRMVEAVAALQNDESNDVLVQVVLSLYKSESTTAKAVISEILAAHADNEMLAATKRSLDKNEDVRMFGARLANLPADDRKLI